MARGDILFVHNNFPAQFGFIADALKATGDRVAVVGSQSAKSETLPVRRWKLARGTTDDIFPIATRAEADLLRARAAAGAALAFKQQGFEPEVIVAHPGWGETLLLAEVFPQARQLLHGEFYYHATGADVGFDPEFEELDLEERFRVRAKNLGLAAAYADADSIICPTPFQASLLPAAFRDRARIIHEGVDVDVAKPRPNARVKLPNGRVLDGSQPVITLVNRNFEPLRGFHVFMRALPKVLAETPQAQVVLVGRDGRGYGGKSGDQRTWRERMLDEVGDQLDLDRVHFVGALDYPDFLNVLAISTAHVYFTYPFVLSWSLLDAMACECLVIASDTAPVRDLVEDGKDGVLVDFFDVEGLSKALIEACRYPAKFQALRKAARRKMVEGYDRKRHSLPAWLAEIDRLRGR